MKQQIRELARNWDKYLHLKGREHWRIDGVQDPRAFFAALPIIFPIGSTLMFEGLAIGDRARALFREKAALSARRVACDTLDPIPEAFHVIFDQDLAERLCAIMATTGVDSCCCHFKGYSENQIIFTFHGAFEESLVLSINLPEEAVRDFSERLGLQVVRDSFPTDPRVLLEQMDRSLNPTFWQRARRLIFG